MSACRDLAYLPPGRACSLEAAANRTSDHSLVVPSSTTSRQPSQEGFTLIEILVVVALLGIIVAIVLLNITGFMGSGAVESANTEAHQVQTAVIAYMEANGLRPADLEDMVVDKDGPPEVDQYLLNPSRLQAKYTISNGVISDAYPYPDGKWADCIWHTEAGEWRVEE